MIVILLVIAAAAFLLGGVITANIVLTYVSLGIAALPLFLLLGDFLRRRRNANSPGEPDECGDVEADLALTGLGAVSTTTAESTDSTTAESKVRTAGAAPSVKAPPKEAVSKEATPPENSGPENATSRVGGSDEVSNTAIDSFPMRNGDALAPRDAPSPVERVLDTEVVLVVPGRKRFHRNNCELLSSRNTEELTVDEAREEGFTPCTTCTAETLIPAR